ncbi:osmoprotectant transport system permease protein [Paraoerskovia marina]|uniref:Osmoprotectant transport system permease protein n=1 Tax=Paraoerskovia marina TaxID=545619 RepID=A0A1H1MZD4_9CELL|nr:ABC transporter permease [Paraoerskovia marina]SDR91785.1 osmoprotectant transport system permease protein [Paraoerskovia marina]
MSWALDNLDLVWELTLDHVRLSVLPIVLSFVLAIPLGFWANRNRTARAIIVGAGSLLYTIPSLPLFVILPLIIGTRVLDETNLVVALIIYGLALMMRSATDAFASVDPLTLQAADAMGFSGFARFWRVDLPLAGPVLLAGIRVVSVSTIALVSVGVLIGSRNLGYLFQDGKQRGILAEVGTGIVASLLIALVFDIIIVLIGRLTLPWNRSDDDRPREDPIVAPAGEVAR